MFADERKARILDAVNRQGRATVAELSELLGASASTIRRDLQDLEALGLLRRAHGGAVAAHIAAHVAGFEPTIEEKNVQLQAEKFAIGQAAARLVQPGDTVMMDAGTTTLQVARHLPAQVTVITNSVDVAQVMQMQAAQAQGARAQLQVLLIGGQLRPATGALVGPWAERALSEVHVDILFLGANGIDPARGITTPNPLEASVKTAMVRAARRVVLVADHSKCGQVSLMQVCSLRQVDIWVTDATPPPDVMAACEAQGVEVMVAPPPDAPDRQE
ncbi:DeoR/GlpR family DNA-binding transcription regulator [Alicyclobacillus sp.]|uniref:DeoR/GlpR family DNA-binding transcription regulator n=1 Tax=Alicyclobacillus sp. TaxID=61169 RepID=UPI0025C0EAD2|nr:DeoR/GlpR family DNA-binding transcription regulator [Alicyclobacillus sp.]MCL6516115.1 DeoR/GlpR family DNA-binding transcription regulator [Alicyclobacillus sp.]